jgi:hypothetical protein
MYTIKATHLKIGNHPTKSHVYMGNEHHDVANMGHNQSIVTQNLFLSFGPRPYDQVHKSREVENKVNNQ